VAAAKGYPLLIKDCSFGPFYYGYPLSLLWFVTLCMCTAFGGRVVCALCVFAPLQMPPLPPLGIRTQTPRPCTYTLLGDTRRSPARRRSRSARRADLLPRREEDWEATALGASPPAEAPKAGGRC